MSEALVGDGFVRALMALRNRYHTKQHRFFDRWVAGDLTKLQMGRRMAQHFQLVRLKARWLYGTQVESTYVTGETLNIPIAV